jgi:hypothetical protein
MSEMKWKEKVDETAEKLYDMVKSDKYNIELHLPKKAEKMVQVKGKRPTSHTKKWAAKNH